MFYFIIGYILAIVFPIPLLNSGIISLWNKIGAEISVWMTKSSSPTPTTAPTTTPTPTSPF